MEIERKFLCKYPDFDVCQYPKKELEQAYISVNPTIRIRKSDDDFVLTIKGSGEISREEYELSITEEQYKHLLEKSETSIVSKTRYFIPLKGAETAELDIYRNDLDGLMTVEVEFNTVTEAENFLPPIWFGLDVSHDNRYKNSNLAKKRL